MGRLGLKGVDWICMTGERVDFCRTLRLAGGLPAAADAFFLRGSSTGDACFIKVILLVL